MNALGAVLFVVALLLSVVIHEAGHFFTARAFGMKASQFFVGFGKTLWSTTRGETEYGLKAIPAGGFVKIVGMIPDEEVAEEDQARAFWRQRPLPRTIVLAAGSFNHFVLGGLLILGIAFFQPIGTVQTTISAVSHCVNVSGATTSRADGPACVAGQVPAPAVSVIQAGDRLVSIDGATVTSWDQAARRIRSSAGRSLEVVLQRAGQLVTVHVTPATVQASDGSAPIGRIGVAPTFTYVSPTLHSGLRRAGTLFGLGDGSIIRGTVDGFAHLPSKFSSALFTGQRSLDGPQSVVGIARISGDLLSAPHEPASVRIWDFLGLIASVNIFFGILNLFPLLPFDGGHIALIVADQVRAGLARLRRRPAPARISYSTVAPASYAVFLLIIVASLAVMAADVINPVRL